MDRILRPSLRDSGGGTATGAMDRRREVSLLGLGAFPRVRHAGGGRGPPRRKSTRQARANLGSQANHYPRAAVDHTLIRAHQRKSRTQVPSPAGQRWLALDRLSLG